MGVLEVDRFFVFAWVPDRLPGASASLEGFGLKKPVPLSLILSILSWLLSAIWFSLIVVWLSPYASRKVPISPGDIAAFPGYRSATAKAGVDLRAALPHLNRVERIGTEPITPLLFVQYRFIATPSPSRDALEFQPINGDMNLRYDRLVGAITALVGCVLLGMFMNIVRRNSRKSGQADPKSEEPIAERPPIGSLKDIIYKEIAYSGNQCRQVTIRSNLMLWLGALVAISGMGALYFLFPEKTGDSKLEALLLVRAFTIVVYVEAFALLLLKQYRQSLDDFAYFNSLRTRNVHYLNCLLALETESADVGKWFSAVLLTEDPLRGRQRRKAKTGRGAAETDGAVSKEEEDLVKPFLVTLLKELRESTPAGSLEK